MNDWRQVVLCAAALETGLLDAHIDPRTPEQAADHAGLDRRATAITVRALVARDVLVDAGEGRNTLSAAGRALVDPPTGDGPDPVGALMLEARALTNHAHLTEILRGAPARDDVSRGDDVTRARFQRAMRQVAAPRVPHTVAALGAPRGGRRLLDVGGGPGSYAYGFADAGWRVSVFDLPETLAPAAAAFAAAGIATIPGDATVGLPDGPWDAIYMGNLVHLLSADQARDVIGAAGGRLAPGGVLAVQEVLGDRSAQGPDFGVMMLVSTAAGDAWPEEAYRRWMGAAGLGFDPPLPLDGGRHHLLIGRRS